MMSIVEISLGRGSAGHVRIRPRLDALTIAQVDLASIGAADVGRAVRETLSSPRRTSATDRLPVVRVSIEHHGLTREVIDDAARQVRILRRGKDGKSTTIEADTSSLADDIRLEVILSEIAGAFGIAVTEDLRPALGWSASSNGELSELEAGFREAYERARELGLSVRAIDARLLRTRGPKWRIPIDLSARLFRRLTGDARLEAARTRRSKERELARKEARELAEHLIAKGIEPDEVLARRPVSYPGVPIVLHRSAISTAELTELSALKRQVIVLVEPGGLLFAEGHKDAVQAFAE
jgi:hypothetical protein